MASRAHIARLWRRARHPSEAASVLLLLLLGSACALVWMSLRRPLVPSELPSLRLSAAEARAVVHEDRRLSAQVPDAPELAALDENFLAQGRADDALFETSRAHAQRAVARRRLAAQVVEAHGQEALWALRARAVERLEQALSGGLDGHALPGVLGVFPNLLAANGVTRRGREVAPALVTRAMYKARWNHLHGLPPAAGFQPVEARAYFGWQALHALAIPIPTRLEALASYAAAGGERALEARGVLLFLNAEYAAAAQALTAAHAEHPSLRLRNYAAGARIAAEAARRAAKARD